MGYAREEEIIVSAFSNGFEKQGRSRNVGGFNDAAWEARPIRCSASESEVVERVSGVCAPSIGTKTENRSRRDHRVELAKDTWIISSDLAASANSGPHPCLPNANSEVIVSHSLQLGLPSQIMLARGKNRSHLHAPPLPPHQPTNLRADQRRNHGGGTSTHVRPLVRAVPCVRGGERRRRTQGV